MLSMWDINNDGSLDHHRPFSYTAAAPDRMCIDAKGGVWVACPYFTYGDSGGYLYFNSQGEIKDIIPVDDPSKSAYACCLSGIDGRDLYLCESTRFGQTRHLGDGRIRSMRVDVPAA